jgi:hypothetical protein
MPGEGLTHGPTAKQNAGGSHHWFSQIIRHSVRDGFNGVLRALPGDRAFLPPSPASFVTLRVSLSVGRPGPHDFSIRDVISRPRKGCALTPSHPASRVVTIAHTSLLPRRDGRKDHIISEKQNQNIFRELSGQQRSRSRRSLAVLHSTDRSRVQYGTHSFVAFLAYCLHVTLRARLKPLAPGLTSRAVLDKMAAVQMLDVYFPTTDGRTLILSRYTELNADQKLLLKQLKRDLPPQPPPRITSSQRSARPQLPVL